MHLSGLLVDHDLGERRAVLELESNLRHRHRYLLYVYHVHANAGASHVDGNTNLADLRPAGHIFGLGLLGPAAGDAGGRLGVRRVAQEVAEVAQRPPQVNRLDGIVGTNLLPDADVALDALGLVDGDLGLAHDLEGVHGAERDAEAAPLAFLLHYDGHRLPPLTLCSAHSGLGW